MKKLNLIISGVCIIALAILQGCSDTKADEKGYSRIQLIEHRGDYRIIRVDSIEFITYYGGGIYPLPRKEAK